MKAAIITASDRSHAGLREDLSGPRAAALLKAHYYEVAAYEICPDDQALLAEKMIFYADVLKVDLILTTGGTGFAPRDVTPEATRQVVERLAEGIPEAMRQYSLKLTSRAMLSRGVAGIRGGTLIVNLPGSPKAVEECLEYILEPLSHGLELLKGQGGDCAR